MIKMLVAVGLPVLILGACGAPSSPGPPPVADRYGAPIPTRALDGAAQAVQPCGALRSDQLRQLGVAPEGRLDPLPTGSTACVWESVDGEREFSVAFYPTRDFLVDSYRVRNSVQRFESITVAGFPAALQQSPAGSTTCTVTTGIAIGQAIDVQTGDFATATSDPCGLGVRVSEAVVANLPAAGGK